MTSACPSFNLAIAGDDQSLPQQVWTYTSNGFSVTVSVMSFLLSVCRGVQVLVDGAHCFGSMPVSMRQVMLEESLAASSL